MRQTNLLDVKNSKSNKTLSTLSVLLQHITEIEQREVSWESISIVVPFMRYEFKQNKMQSISTGNEEYKISRSKEDKFSGRIGSTKRNFDGSNAIDRMGADGAHRELPLRRGSGQKVQLFARPRQEI